MTELMTAGLEAITSTRVYVIHPKLYIIVVAILIHNDVSNDEHNVHLLVQAQLH